jgi:hypothetical protein
MPYAQEPHAEERCWEPEGGGSDRCLQALRIADLAQRSATGLPLEQYMTIWKQFRLAERGYEKAVVSSFANSEIRNPRSEIPLFEPSASHWASLG